MPSTVTGDVNCDVVSGMPVRKLAIIHNLKDGETSHNITVTTLTITAIGADYEALC